MTLAHSICPHCTVPLRRLALVAHTYFLHIACGNLDHLGRLTRSFVPGFPTVVRLNLKCRSDRRQAVIVSASFDCLYIVETLSIH